MPSDSADELSNKATQIYESREQATLRYHITITVFIFPEPTTVSLSQMCSST